MAPQGRGKKESECEVPFRPLEVIRPGMTKRAITGVEMKGGKRDDGRGREVNKEKGPAKRI